MASGNPAKKATERKISQVGDFKKRVQSIEELPSGLVVKLRNPGGLNAFLGKDAQGEIPNALMPIIQKALKQGKNVDPSELMGENGELDLQLLNDMQTMMDNIAVKVMIEPNLRPSITMADVEKYNEGRDASLHVDSPEDLRQDNVLYVDELPEDDKQYIFGWLTGGVKDLETFRQQRQAGVDAVAGIPVAQGDTQ